MRSVQSSNQDSALPRVAVFASGSGSNFEALARAAQTGSLDADIALLVCDKCDAGAIGRAQKLGVPSICVDPADSPTKEAYEQQILWTLEESQIQYVALAGYMRLVGPTLLQPYEGRMVNIHPSLLPAFPGLNAIPRSFEAGEGGVTVHLVDSGMDTGPILAQQPVEIVPGEPLEAFETRLHSVEHALYPQVLQQLIGGLT